MTSSFPVAIIGGGPVGMAAAAHLVKRNKAFVLIEKGETVGAALMQWKHVRLFSPWEYTIDLASEELLVLHGWTSPPKDKLPTGEEMVQDYLQPLAELPEMKPHIVTGGRVVAIQRYGIDKMKTASRETFPFEVIYEKDGAIHCVFASALFDATGTWESPNPVGASGNLATGENENASQIYYGIPEVMGQHRSRYAGKTVAVVGSGHSAINTLLELDRLKQEEPDTEIVWVLRKKSVAETFGGGDNDALPARGSLGTRASLLVKEGRVRIHSPFRTHTIENMGGMLRLIGLSGHQTSVIDGVDDIVVNTGARPDFSYIRELRYHADAALECVPELADLIDPNIHSCGTVRPHGEAELRQPEKNFYVVGSKSYGRAPTFLMATGYEQVRSIAAALSGDWEAARKVELHLPETGVCGAGQREP
ncbi:MAG: NAD(P)-binding domain-containing protein [Bacilli bacterium]